MKIAIAGISGVLGNAFFEESKNRSEIKLINLEKEILDDSKKIETILISNSVDVIINCVAVPSNRVCLENPLYGVKGNLSVPLNLLSAAKSSSCKIFQFSSHAVFPSSKTSKSYTEDEEPKPDTFYGEMKLVLEALGRELVGTNCITVRLPSLYGERRRMRTNIGLLERLLIKLKGDEDVTINPEIYDSPTYAAEVARYIFEVVYKGVSLPSVLHLSCSGVCSLLEFCEKAKDIVNSKSRIEVMEDKNLEAIDCRACNKQV